MTREEHLKLLASKMAKNLEIAKKKNQDYCGKGESSDPFKNFRISEQAGVPVEQGILVRMYDKMSRISTLLSQDAQVKDESVQDTLSDLSNYSLILSNYLDSKKIPTMEQVKNFRPYNPEDNYIDIGNAVRVTDPKSFNLESEGTVTDCHYSEDGYENEYVVKINGTYVLLRESQICKI